jgi:hypothetical protein
MSAAHPTLLLDSPDDGYCESTGWVETVVTEDEARNLLAEWCMDENGDMPFRPVGAIKRVHMAPEKPGDETAEQMWHKSDEDAPGAMEFWEITVT